LPGEGATEVGGHFLDERVALRVNGGGVKRVGGIADAEETGGLLEGLGSEAGHAEQVGA
jgi:hypothetical protein